MTGAVRLRCFRLHKRLNRNPSLDDKIKRDEFPVQSILSQLEIMGFHSPDSGIAASVFLALYTLFLGQMTYIMIKRGFKNVYTFIFFFTLFRFGGQLCGVVYAALGPLHYKWLIAYLVLGAEGYFALIFAGFRFTCRAQYEKFGESWMLHKGPNVGNLFILKRLCKSWSRIFHLTLIPANALVISGGSMLAGILYDDMAKEHNTVMTSKALRTTGQAIFLSMTLCLIFLTIYVFVVEKVRNHTTIAVLCGSPFILVRGIFGVLSIYITEMNYFQFSNYDEEGKVNHKLVVYEYVLSTTMEFITASLLMTKYWFDLKHPSEQLLLENKRTNNSSNSDPVSSIREQSMKGVLKAERQRN